MLRGRHYLDIDAKAAERILGIVPEIRDTAWSNRGFHQRAAKWIAGQGVRQFIDIGAGLPTVGNTHEVVQRVQPGARVVYVDNDPVVELLSEQILGQTDTVGVICADLREPETILGHPRFKALIDPAQPAGLLMTGVMMFIADSSRPWDLVAHYTSHLAPGSYLALSHLTDDAKPPAAVAGFRGVFDSATEQLYFRSRDEVARFFAGLDMVPPYDGAAPEINYSGMWGAEDVELADSDGSRWLYSGVAEIP
jgi:hypothetical protein